MRCVERKYPGFTRVEYRVMYADCKGRCEICRLPAAESSKGRLYVDHDHDTGKVRGLLCGHCNAGIGYFRENSQHLRAAISYLKSHEVQYALFS